MEIIQQFIPVSNKETRPGISMIPTYITIHETDNTDIGADAEAHAQLQVRGNTRQASWHVQVDDHEAIQSIPFDEVAWAAGDGADGPGNRSSIHIEICVNSDGNYRKAVANAAVITRQLRLQFSIPLDHVVQHYHWSGKDCPRHLRAGDWGITWDDFIKMSGNGWVLENSVWYFYQDGNLLKNGWVKHTDGMWYYLKADGKMAANEWVKWKDKWYFLKASGKMAAAEWVKWKDKWYYLDQTGAMKQGWVFYKNLWYYLDPAPDRGEMLTGWITYNGKIYYCNPAPDRGEMFVGTRVIDGKTYVFDDSGALIQ